MSFSTALRLWAFFLISATAYTQEPLVIRTGTRMVEMTVIVQDAKGNPVTDLTRGNR